MLLNACVRINIVKGLQKVILNNNYNKLNLSIWVNVL